MEVVGVYCAGQPENQLKTPHVARSDIVISACTAIMIELLQQINTEKNHSICTDENIRKSATKEQLLRAGPEGHTISQSHANLDASFESIQVCWGEDISVL